MNSRNLQSWQPGTSGNPKGRPKGSRNVKNIIRDLLTDENSYSKLPISAPEGTQTPLEAIVYTLIVKSINGDVRASDVLLKYVVDRDLAVESDSFFSQPELTIRVVDSSNNPYSGQVLEIDEQAITAS